MSNCKKGEDELPQIVFRRKECGKSTSKVILSAENFRRVRGIAAETGLKTEDVANRLVSFGLRYCTITD